MDGCFLREVVQRLNEIMTNEIMNTFPRFAALHSDSYQQPEEGTEALLLQMNVNEQHHRFALLLRSASTTFIISLVIISLRHFPMSSFDQTQRHKGHKEIILKRIRLYKLTF